MNVQIRFMDIGLINRHKKIAHVYFIVYDFGKESILTGKPIFS